MSTYMDTNKEGKAVYSSITYKNTKGESVIPPCPECNINHTKEEYMHSHYTLTLTTRTTMVWLVLSTLYTLCMVGLHAYTNAPTWGGVYTWITILTYHGVFCTMVWGCTHCYVRKHGQIVLSTRDLENIL